MAETVSLSPHPKKPRFATVDEAKMEKILKEKDSENTQKATARSMRLLVNYLTEKGMPTDIDNVPLEQLDQLLAQFYTEARNENGDLYKASTLKNTRYGIQRFLSEKRNIDILKDTQYTTSNKVFKAMSVQLKREGLGGIEHYPPIEEDDLLTIYSSLSDVDPSSLQQKVFVDVMLYFGRRGRENLRNLKKSDFEISKTVKRQGDGHKEITYQFVRIKRDKLTKNHKNDTNTAVGKMYEVKGDLQCPLKSFLKYTPKLNDNCDAFFQRPKREIKDESTWYDAVPLGHNILGGLTNIICEKAGIEKRYTNHSLRATTVHVLDVAELAGRHIMSVTGHKSEHSLKTYTGYTSDKALHKRSNVISESFRPEKKTEHSAEKPATNENEDIAELFENDTDNVDFLLLTNSQMDMMVQDVANENENSNSAVNQISSMNNTYNQVSNLDYQVTNVMNNNATYTCYPRPGFNPFGCPNFPIITNNYGSININYNILPK